MLFHATYFQETGKRKIKSGALKKIILRKTTFKHLLIKSTNQLVHMSVS